MEVFKRLITNKSIHIKQEILSDAMCRQCGILRRKMPQLRHIIYGISPYPVIQENFTHTLAHLELDITWTRYSPE